MGQKTPNLYKYVTHGWSLLIQDCGQFNILVLLSFIIGRLKMFKLVLMVFLHLFFRKVRNDMAMAKREQAAQAEERQPYIFLRKMRSDPSSRVSLLCYNYLSQ